MNFAHTENIVGACTTALMHDVARELFTSADRAALRKEEAHLRDIVHRIAEIVTADGKTAGHARFEAALESIMQREMDTDTRLAQVDKLKSQLDKVPAQLQTLRALELTAHAAFIPTAQRLAVALAAALQKEISACATRYEADERRFGFAAGTLKDRIVRPLEVALRDTRTALFVADGGGPVEYVRRAGLLDVEAKA